MQKLFCVILTLSLTAGCNQISPFIDNEQLEARLDLDNDGIPRPDDCDDLDHKIGIIHWYKDLDSDGIGGNEIVTACLKPSGTAGVSGDCDDTKKNVFPKADEICDGFDNDCNGQTDEGLDKTWYQDSDKDLFGDPNKTKVDCKKPDGYVEDSTDCDDTKSSIKPGALELCDSIDQNCNGETDEGLDVVWYQDSDKDTHGNPEVSKVNCKKPDGYVANNSDCNDKSSSIKPSANESCNLIDDNCNGETDEGLIDAWYKDSDNDTYGDAKSASYSCNKKDGYVNNKLDCNDNNENVNPGKTEICDDNIDQNCNGIVDDAVGATLWYPDSDKDGFGSPVTQIYACKKPEGYADNYKDCDDSNFKVNPSAKEACKDLIDNDCNGITDTDAIDVSWYKDFDKDNYGDLSSAVTACSPPDGYVDNSEDCDDSTVEINPSAAEICNNGIDDNCDKSVNQCKLPNTSTTEAVYATLYGATSGDKFGSAIGIADIDNDGTTDIIIGASSAGDYQYDGGAVYSFFGPIVFGTSKNAYKADLTFNTKTAFIYTGTSLFTDDINNDNHADILISSPSHNTPGQSSYAAYLIYGPVKAGAFDLATASVIFNRESKGDMAGHALAGAGDVNKDGYADILIGAYGSDVSGQDSGVAYLVYGPVKPGTFNLANASVIFKGEKAGDFAGHALAGAGDVNKDGYADILIGAYGSDVSGQDSGVAYLVYGPVKPGTFNLANASVLFKGEKTGDFAGSALSEAGDVNKDGYADILIGAYGSDVSGQDSGRAYLVYGPVQPGTFNLANASVLFKGEKTGDFAGHALAGAGDVNKDGYADILIGAYGSDVSGQDSGRAYLIYGPVKPGTFNLANAPAIFNGEKAGDQLGSKLFFGDINKDGRSDILISALLDDKGNPNSGTVYIILGVNQ